jgi:hypothetical protein
VRRNESVLGVQVYVQSAAAIPKLCLLGRRWLEAIGNADSMKRIISALVQISECGPKVSPAEPTRYFIANDSGRPSPVILFRMLHVTSASASCARG